MNDVPGLFSHEAFVLAAAVSPLWLRLRAPLGLLVFCLAVTGTAGLREGACVRADLERPRLEADLPWTPSRRVEVVSAARLRIVSWPRARAGGWEAAAVIRQASGCEGPDRGERLLLAGEGRPPALWASMDCRIASRPPAQATIADGFSMARFLRGRGIDWRADILVREPVAADIPARIGDVLTPLRAGLLTSLERCYPRREACLLSSVLLGERGAETRVVKDPFTDLGLSHLFAVSGLHVGIVAAVLTAILLRLPVGPRLRWTALLAALALYVTLTGLASSTVRAAGLALLALSGPLLGLRIDGSRLLGLLFWGSVVWMPDLCIDAGFRLSYLAAGGIVAGLRLGEPFLDGRPRAVRWLAGSLLVSLGAQWGTMPELAAAFGWVNPLAPLFNLVAVPIFGAAVSLAFVGLLASPWGWASEALAAVAWAPIRGLETAAAVVSPVVEVEGLPSWGPGRLLLYLGGTLALALAMLLAARCSGRRRAGLVSGALTCGGLVFWMLSTEPANGRLRVHQFDIGQGDCALFEFPDRSRVLIDTGGAWRGGGSPFLRTVAPWLRRHDIRRLDTIVLTHHHADHDGAWRDVTSTVDVGRWWALTWRDSLAARLSASAIVASPVAGDTLHRAGRWNLVCVYPPAGIDLPEDENDRSIVAALTLDGRSLGLWTGDLEAAGEGILLEGDPASVRILKAGHHGSRTSSTPAFLEALSPRHLLVSCGVENRHDHPSHGPFLVGSDTLPILRTDLVGTLHLEWDPDADRFLYRRLRRGPVRIVEP